MFTDAYIRAWEPSDGPFFTGLIELADAPGGGTLYTATARHWTDEARDQHRQMGFHEGWGICADQLEQAARKL